MKSLDTPYGTLNGILTVELYSHGGIKECTLEERSELNTPYGMLVPQYQDGHVRRKHTKSLAFYSNGRLKSIALQEQTEIQTPAGKYPAELITFYESGSINRIFPLNGKLSGYWSEDNEYDLAEECDFQFSFGQLKTRFISMHFYENGSIKSLTLWPKERVAIQTSAGEMEARYGISIYASGKLKSLEPVEPTAVSTPIGEISAFNTNAIGVHGDANSLVFGENGKIHSLATATDRVIVEDSQGKKTYYGPNLRPSLLEEDAMDVYPLKISFQQGRVYFENDREQWYDIKSCRFTIKHNPALLVRGCTDCAGCSGCG